MEPTLEKGQTWKDFYIEHAVERATVELALLTAEPHEKDQLKTSLQKLNMDCDFAWRHLEEEALEIDW